MKKYLFLLLIFCTAFAKAQKVTLPAKTVITQPATAATPSAKILSRNASGELVETDKTVTQLDKQNLSEFVDDIGANDAIIANTVFVDTVIGNDATGIIENRGKPFLTEAAAFNAIPNNGNEWTIQFIDGNVTRQITSDIKTKNVVYKTDSDGTLNFSSVPFVTPQFQASPTIVGFPIKILALNATVTFNVTNTVLGSTNDAFYIKCKELNITGVTQIKSTSTIPSVIEADIFNVDIVVSNYGLFNNTRVDLKIGTFNLTNFSFGENFTDEQASLNAFEVDNINLIGGGTKRIFNNGSVSDFKVGNISGAGTLIILDSKGNNNNVVSTITFDNSVIANETTLNIQGGTVRNNFISGNIISKNENVAISARNISSSVQEINFLDFTGQLLPEFNMVRTDIDITLQNSNIETTSYLFRLGKAINGFQNEAGIRSFKTIGYNSILTTSSIEEMIFHQYNLVPLQIENFGTLTTNFKTFGRNVTEVVKSSTFKEKTGEIVIRSKVDIANKILSPFNSYIIDGDIILSTTDSIIVPYVAERPNLTVNGYGLEQSSITKTGGGPVFVSAAGGSGGLQMEGIKLKCTGCPVFDLTDATGFNAVELVKVNIEDSGSIGTLDGYRQGLWSNIGVFNVSDGLTFEGGWLGGFRSQNVIVRNLEGTTGSLFKKGTSLTFGSRFYTNANIDLPTGWSIADFDNTNFTNPNTFQVQNAIITRAGVSDPTDTGYFPNINEENTASEFSGNTGVPNSALNDVKIKSPDGTVFTITVDNAGNITTN